MRIMEREQGEVWKAKFFVTGPAEGFLKHLVDMGDLILDEDKTGGVWPLMRALGARRGLLIGERGLMEK